MPVKVETHPANTHDSITFIPLVDEIRAEHPGVQVGNINADNGYQSPENGKALAIRGINNSIAQRQSNPIKISKKRRNQRKCIEGIIGIGEQHLGFEQTRVRGLENVKKDTLLKAISMLFVTVVSAETGMEDMYLKPTFFFG